MHLDTRTPSNRRAKWFIGGLVLVALLFGAARLGGALIGRGSSAEVLGRGSNANLQLGGQNKNLKTSSIGPLSLTKQAADNTFISAKAGHYHTLLLTKQGTVYAMGDNSQHTVSAAGTPLVGAATPVAFPGLRAGETITKIDSSRDHNVALTSAGRVYTWGSNYTGQLGDDTNRDRGTPAVVTGVPKAVAVTAGYRHTAVITTKGEVWGWGGSCTEATLSAAQALIAQAASNISALGGYGSTKQSDLKSDDVGDCTTQTSTFVQSKVPKKIAGIDGRAVQLSAGYGHLLVLTADGAVYSGGCNTYGQLGRVKATNPATKNDMVRVALPGRATQISAGFRHSAVLLDDGGAWEWGYNGAGEVLHVGQPGDIIQTPARVKTAHTFVSLEAAHDTTFGVTTDGQIVGWGQDDAQAFWSTKRETAINTLGTDRHANALLSAGMQHLLILEKS